MNALPLIVFDVNEPLLDFTTMEPRGDCRNDRRLIAFVREV